MGGYGAGIALSILLTVGFAFFVEFLSRLPNVPQIFYTVTNVFVLVAPIILPGVGVTFGLIYSFKRKGRSTAN